MLELVFLVASNIISEISHNSQLTHTVQGAFEIRHNLQDLQEVNKPKIWLNILNSLSPI
jgi:hypothetical protein